MLRRAAILAGWALAVFALWLGVPFVVSYAVGELGDPAQMSRGELADDALRLAGILTALGVPVLLAWYYLLFSSGLPQTAAIFATLLSLAYAATTAMPAERSAALLQDLRGAAFGFLSIVVSWGFAFALAAILLRLSELVAPAREPRATERGRSETEELL